MDGDTQGTGDMSKKRAPYPRERALKLIKGRLAKDDELKCVPLASPSRPLPIILLHNPSNTMAHRGRNVLTHNPSLGIPYEPNRSFIPAF